MKLGFRCGEIEDRIEQTLQRRERERERLEEDLILGETQINYDSAGVSKIGDVYTGRPSLGFVITEITCKPIVFSCLLDPLSPLSHY